jgi:hypothetical protein
MQDLGEGALSPGLAVVNEITSRRELDQASTASFRVGRLDPCSRAKYQKLVMILSSEARSEESNEQFTLSK